MRHTILSRMVTGRLAAAANNCDANLRPMPLLAQTCCSRHNLSQTQSSGSCSGVCLIMCRPREEWVNNNWARKWEIRKKKSCRHRATAGKNTHIYTVNARPHKKCKVKLPGQGLGCTRPSPRGKPRAARGRDSGARNGTNTATPKRDIFCRDSITALCSQQ